MVACLFIIVAAALIINKGPVGNGGHNSEYPYDDNKVLNYVRATLDDVSTDAGKIVFNEITDIELYRNFNTDYSYEGLHQYDTRFTAFRLLEQYSNQAGIDSFTIYKKNGSFENCIAYSSFLTFSEHFPREAAFAQNLYDFSNQQPIDIRGMPSISTVGFYSQPLTNCILSIVISPDLDSIDSRLAQFLPLFRSTLGTESSSTINGHEVAVHYFYQPAKQPVHPWFTI